MIVSINQPAYLPWLGYFDRIDYADIFVFLDNVQFEKNSYTNRNKILSKNGPIWLTIPVQTSGKFGNLSINTLLIDNKQNWSEKHLKTIEMNYRKTKYFERYFPEIEKIYTQSFTKFIEISDKLTFFFCQTLGINTKIMYSSELETKKTKSDLILEICEKLGASLYVSGKLGRDYLELHKFNEKSIQVVFQEYQHPIYTQKYPNFEPYMCILDLLFNHGENSIDIIRQGRNFVKS